MNILIADDHALFRDTLQHYLNRARPDYKIHMAENFSTLWKMLGRNNFKPDLCIVDYRMPGMKGVESFKEIIQSYPDNPLAVMSGVAEADEIEAVLSLDIRGYLPKTLPGRAMIGGIEKMLAGEKFIPYEQENIKLRLSYTDSAQPVLPDNPSLTRREKQVLQHLCQGRSNKEIADILDLKIVTVKLHVRGILRKLDCDNRTQAVIKAKQLMLVD